jgi:hypothetical protein
MRRIVLAVVVVISRRCCFGTHFYVDIVRRGKCNITYNFEFALNEPYDAQPAHLYVVHPLDHLDHLACHGNAHSVGIFDVGCINFVFFWESIVTSDFPETTLFG